MLEIKPECLSATNEDLASMTVSFQNPAFDSFLFLGAPLFAKIVHASPKFGPSFSPIHIRCDLFKIVSHLGGAGSSMPAGMVNIADVPFALGSGGEKNHLFAFQQKDAVLVIHPNYFEKSFR
jgi:hypothetical protein